MAKLMQFEKFKNRIIEKYGDNFDWAQTEKEYKNFATPITFVCKTHGPCIRTPQQFIDHGCIQCRDERKLENKRLKTIDKLNKKYNESDRHMPYVDFSKITVPRVNTDKNSHMVKIYCSEHGEQEVTIGELLYLARKIACPVCKANYELEHFGRIHGKYTERHSVEASLNKFLKRAHELHGDKYDYSLAPETYRTIESKIQIICPEHGPWWSRGTDHVGTLSDTGRKYTAAGCPKCANAAKAIGRRLTFDEFLERAEQYHGKGKYDYSIVKQEFEEAERLGKTLSEVTIICNECGNIFKQDKRMHCTEGTGCPFCDASSMEKLLKDFLNEIGVKFIYNKSFRWLRHKNLLKIDFYLPEYNIAIEYNGKQHYQIWEGQNDKEELDNIRLRDFKKKRVLERNNIEVIKYSFKESWKSIKDNIIKTLRTRSPKRTFIKGDNSKPIIPFYKRFNKKMKPSLKRNTYSNMSRKKKSNIVRVRKKSFKNVLN